MWEENICLKVSVFEVHIEASLSFPVTVGYFFAASSSVIVIAIDKKAVEHVFILIQFFLLLERARVIVYPWCVRFDPPIDEFEWFI